MPDEIHRDLRLRSMPIRYKVTDRPHSDSLIVMMPTPASAARQAARKSTFSRFNWAHLWPDSEVLALADPALPLREGISGAWFIHPRVDVIALLSRFIRDVAGARDIPLERVCLYGSSLGGFGAIAVASLLPGTTAVAEVPQIDVRDWNTTVVPIIEQEILDGSMEELHHKHPERISLIDRIRTSGHVPAIRLISNARDPQRVHQRAFFEHIRDSDLPRTGHVEMITTDEVRGHKLISESTAKRMVTFQS